MAKKQLYFTSEGVALTRIGVILKVGAIPQYSTIEYNPATGEVYKIQPEENQMARHVKTVKTETIVRTELGDDGVAANINHLAELHRERGALYGNDFMKGGGSLMSIFPDGVELRTPKDFTRYSLLNQMHAKFVRYCERFNEGGHADSLDDLAVYSQMLKYVDEVK